ncbi:hypothetical protein HIM_06803 [Hirsutella minnesotensis 3608]|uniref:Uncharacterized protein n=1 Tax=Hirsutella minnesotensis 3608 TaxID=1043627 RepID=A0A0F7ZNK5_9HYPO|nr:hypothetical protein HIM_06803 [Hirsutella minnesotensis 3608]
MSAPSPEYALGPRCFKKHKVLPRPHDHRSLDKPRAIPMNHSEYAAISALSTLQPAVNQEAWKVGNRPDLPPTPPNNFRHSPINPSTVPSSLSTTDSNSDTTPYAAKRSVATPPDQRSPPTPDVTPPGPAVRSPGSRSLTLDSGQSRFAVSDSRTESFKTAREEAASSDEEGARLAVGHALGSVSVPQQATLRLANSQRGPAMHPQELDLALNRLQLGRPGTQPARGRQAYVNFSRGWRPPVDTGRGRDERIVADQSKPATLEYALPLKQFSRNRATDRGPVPPTLTTKEPSSALREQSISTSSPRRSSGYVAPVPSTSNASSAVDTKRLSGQSVKSNPSTIIEAILVDRLPQRQRTLRHVPKRGSLREATSLRLSFTDKDLGAPSPEKSGSLLQTRESGSRRNSHGSSTPNSIASGRARRQVWKEGGIPVVVVPDRRSSSNSRSGQRHSLRSTSSRRSRRAPSPGSSPEVSPTRNTPPVVDSPQRGRRPEVDRAASEQRTIDFPPTPPARSSSFSAHLSREGSNLVLLEDLGQSSHNLQQHAQVGNSQHTTSPAHEREPNLPTEKDPQFPGFIRSEDDKHDECNDLLSLGRHDDTLSSRKFSSRNTPFSIASFDTSGTAPEVSEAFAVHMYPHQNSSVLMVDHQPKPASLEQTDVGANTAKLRVKPTIRTTSPGGGPVTPPRQASDDELDSPLRNPRPPPPPPKQPPAINFIPATPSGLTPAQEKLVQLGNYFERTEEAPSRRPSIMRRAFGGRRHSIDYSPSAARSPGFLTRTLSLSRNVRRPSEVVKPTNPDADPAYPKKGAPPAEEDKLHPFWQPSPLDDGPVRGSEHIPGTESHRFECCSHVDPWARYPKRSLSTRMKRTFAIFPISDDDRSSMQAHGPDRRVIRRTPSGNLKVVSRRSSMESSRAHESGRDSHRPDYRMNERRSFWRRGSLRRSASHKQMRRSASQSRWGGMQSLPRILSERRREKRSQELRQMISGPKDVRDGVQDLIEPKGKRIQQRGEDYSLI